MKCVCGHSDDLHEIIASDDEINMGIVIGGCDICLCTEFCEDIDDDENEDENEDEVSIL